MSGRSASNRVTKGIKKPNVIASFQRVVKSRQEQQRADQEQQERIATMQQDINRQQSDLAGRTAGSLRARRGRSSLDSLGTNGEQSTLG